MKESEIHDVVVIGAGPAGCYSAAGIAEKGFDVVVLERESLPRSTPVCTGVIGTEAFRQFDISGGSVLSEVKDISLFSPSGKEIAYRPSMIQAYAVDRGAFDHELRERAARSGAVLLMGTGCKDIRTTDHCVEIATTKSGEVVRAKMLILASGYNPGLTAKLGLQRIPEYFEGVQVEAGMNDLQQTEIYVGRSVAPSSFAWVLPVGVGRARIGLTAPRKATECLMRLLDAAHIKKRIVGMTKPACKLIPYGHLERSYSDRALVVGEAAGQVKSTTHGGIYYGLIGARCAVETATEALQQGCFGSSFLSRYEDHWKALLGKDIDRGFLLRKFFSKLTDSHIERLFDLSAKDGIMRSVYEKAQFDWHDGIIKSLFEHPLLKRYFG